MTLNPGDVISHAQMCIEEGLSLQKGMNYLTSGKPSIFLMSLRKGAPYNDKVEDDGKILIYEGHDAQKNWTKQHPKEVDQPLKTPRGFLTENGKFFEAAKRHEEGSSSPELIKVYEKIKTGIWVYNGIFQLIDAWVEKNNKRSVIKFKLKITDKTIDLKEQKLKEQIDLDHNRLIPSNIKLQVWKRDKGQCTQCGSKTNLHFDHILPYSKGGTSLKVENIQLLCAKHNLRKHAKIE